MDFKLRLISHRAEGAAWLLAKNLDDYPCGKSLPQGLIVLLVPFAYRVDYSANRSQSPEAEMKNRMQLFIVGLVCYSLCFVSNKLIAQTPAQKLQRLSQVLNLSAQQKGEMLPILEQEGPKLKAIKNNPDLTPGQKAMQLRAIHQHTDPQVKTILSPQQYQEWKTIRQHEIEQAIHERTEGPE